METCGTCKYWFKENDDKFGTCDMTYSLGGEPSEPRTKAYASDHESYRAYLMTTSDFGCVQYERKDS
jgi:hypothetical protein